MDETQMTIGQALVAALRRMGTFTTGDQVKPCAILWTDPQRLWGNAIGELKALLPELFEFGAYDSEHRCGPAIWLRCIEARAIEPRLAADVIPVFYLPGVSRQQLREVEEVAQDLQTLVELQFRGSVWLHTNGRDWTPLAFLTSERGGLNLDVGRDAATGEALGRALTRLLAEKVADLRGRRLDADYFNGLLAPDPPRELLLWMNNPDDVRAAKDEYEWGAFCRECQAHYGIDPEKDGELLAAEKLGARKDRWLGVWERFVDAPGRYQGVVKLLERVDPTAGGNLPLDPEPWPKRNDAEERRVADALTGLRDKRWDEAAGVVHELERIHGCRRSWVWRELGRCQMAAALEYLDRLATFVARPLAAASADDLAEQYVRSGWETDAAALAALACPETLEYETPVRTAVRSLYQRWLDESARNLQTLIQSKLGTMSPRLGPLEAIAGRVVLFADGLRFDIAQKVAASLKASGCIANLAWDWAPVPTVTATAKPQASPLAHLFKGGEAGDEFAVTIVGTGQRLTAERFAALLSQNGIEVLSGLPIGNISAKAWVEGGSLDKRGHREGWKLAKLIEQEVKDLAAQIQGLLASGWREVVVVTDHGWLLLPDGFPKIELSRHAVENRWGRCAAMRPGAPTELPLYPWHWNPAVSVASPPGIGCFVAGMEYVHGGVSAQESIIPRMTVTASAAAAVTPRLAKIKWVGLRCRVTVEGPAAGLKVDLRARAADAASTKVEGKKPKDLAPDGTVSLAVPDDREMGNPAVVVLLTADDKVIHTLPTEIGVNP
jgi:hypothetical protein